MSSVVWERKGLEGGVPRRREQIFGLENIFHILVFNVYLFLRERERERESRGGAERERERENPKQVLHCQQDRKSTRLNSSHSRASRMPSSA